MHPAISHNTNVSVYISIVRNMKRSYTDDKAIALVKSCNSISSVLKGLGLNPTAGTHYKVIWNLINKHGIDVSHFTGQAWKKGNHKDKFPLSDYLVNHGIRRISSCKLKFKLYRAGFKKPACEICGTSQWQSKPVPTELHHINGDNKDNRLENLQLLCANCHGQTKNFCLRKDTRKLMDT